MQKIEININIEKPVDFKDMKDGTFFISNIGSCIYQKIDEHNFFELTLTGCIKYNKVNLNSLELFVIPHIIIKGIF